MCVSEHLPAQLESLTSLGVSLARHGVKGKQMQAYDSSIILADGPVIANEGEAEHLARLVAKVITVTTC